MAYKSNIPLATDKLSSSQPDINGNFTEINTYVNVDHIAFNGADQGKHKKTTFPVAAAPGAVGATEVGLYAATHLGMPELFINKTADQVPFTYALKANPGWCILPSGIIIKWGSFSINPSATLAITFSVSVPAFTQPPIVTNSVFQGANNSLTVSLTAVTTTTATFYNGNNVGGALTAHYMAIGY